MAIHMTTSMAIHMAIDTSISMAIDMAIDLEMDVAHSLFLEIGIPWPLLDFSWLLLVFNNIRCFNRCARFS